MFAQFQPDAVQFAAWIGCASFVMVLINQGIALHRSLRGSPVNEALGCEAGVLKERLVATEQRMAANEEYGKSRRNAIYEEIRKANAAADERVDNLRRETQALVGELHEKFNGVDRAVAGLQAEAVSQTRQLANMDAKIDRLIERKS